MLAALDAAGVYLRRSGDALIVETQPGASVEPFFYEIAAHKSELLVALDARAAAMRRGLDPALAWVCVYRGPVDASPPAANWNGIAPDGCDAPIACGPLGPCHHFTEHGRCWAEGDRL